jgi:replicative DNA helicase
VYRSAEAWLTAQDFIRGEDFHFPLNRALWTVLDALRAKQVALDPITVQRELPEAQRQELDQLGGWSWLDSLNDQPVEPSNVMHYAKQLRDLSTKRRMHAVGQTIQDMVLGEPETPAEALQNKIEVLVNEIPGVTNGIIDLADVSLEFLKERMANVKEIPGYTTGFPVFDEYTSGLRPGDLCVFAGAPGCGKSTILLNIAKHLAFDDGLRVGWMATEHSAREEVSRYLSMASGVEEKLIGNGMFSQIPDYLDRVAEAEDKIRSLSNFKFLSLPKFRLEQVERYAAKMVRQHDIQALFFDYIRIPDSGSGDNFWRETGDFTYGLKALATKFSIPVVSAVQVNRKGREAVKWGEDLTVDFLANSDDIGRAASIAAAIRELTKKELETRTVDVDHCRAVQLVKNRHGAKGYRMEYSFLAETLTLVENSQLV